MPEHDKHSPTLRVRRRESIRARLIAMGVIPSMIALSVACFAYVYLEYSRYGSEVESDLRRLATLIADNCVAALQFEDSAASNEILATLASQPGIDVAGLYDAEGVLVSKYRREGLEPSPGSSSWGVPPKKTLFQREHRHQVTQAIMVDGERIGTVFLQGNEWELAERVSRFLRVSAAMGFSAAVLSLLAVMVLQKRISDPIRRLALASRSIAEEGDYSIRAEWESNDELGEMTVAFNSMVDQVERHRETLENEVRNRTAELREAKELAEDASRAKSEFLANMSHEIRTPLNGILGLTEDIAESNLSETQMETVRTILDSGQLLLEIINDILDCAKVEAGFVSLEQKNFDLREAISDVMALLQPRIRDKQVEVRFVYPESEPRYFVGDSMRIRQMLLNLCGNAIKFTDQGFVEVRVHCDRVSEGRSRVEILVEDTGVGMDADTVDHVFDRFAQADSSTTRRYGGTGLGLAITMGLAELMHGGVSVESTPGEGSTFRIQLNLQLGDPPEQVAELVHATAKDQVAGLRVLVVEDNSVNRMVISRQLERLECHVHLAENGQEGVEAISNSQYDLVLMDCMMPVMDGYAATSAIRALGGPAARVPIVALTANVMMGNQERCFEAGMNDVLNKPISKDRLTAALVRWGVGPKG